MAQIKAFIASPEVSSTQFTDNAPFTFANTPRTMHGLFEPGADDWSMSLFKDTTIHDKLQFQLRAEAFNTFNRVQFGAPNAHLNSPAFGVINNQQNGPRTLQLGARMTF